MLKPGPNSSVPLVIFFDVTTMLTMFVSRDVHLESPSNDKSSAAISCLMALTPFMATIYTDATYTREKKILTELLQIRDTPKSFLET